MNQTNTMSRDFLQRAESFQKRIGYQFSRPELLHLAFVQRSSESSQSPSQNNERLEFLGDAAIGLIVGSALYGEYPEADEGFMTIERSKLVCGQNLSAWGYEAGFDRMISAGEGVLITAAMVEDSVEAVAGALFLDGGLEAVKSFLQSFGDYPDQGTGFDARRHLERDCEFEKLGAPKFKTVRRWANGGRIFETTVTLNGKEAGTGLGSDQITAERNAARDALGRLNRVSAAEQQKRAAVQRAHFRRVLSGRIRASRKETVVSLSEAEQQSAISSAAAVRKANTPVAVSVPSAETVSAPGSVPADAKERLDALCAHLRLGTVRYVDAPVSQKAGKARAGVSLMLNKENLVTAVDETRERAEQRAAWRVVQVLTAGEQGREKHLQDGLGDLTSRLEAAFAEEMRKSRRRELRFEMNPSTENTSLITCRIVAGTGAFITEVSAFSEEQARLHAIVRGVTQTRSWPGVLKKLGIPFKVKKPEIPPRPDLIAADQLKSRGLTATKISVQAGGADDAPVFAVGWFVGEELAACMTGPNKKIVEALLALLLLDRNAHGRPLVPPPAETRKTVPKAAAASAPSPLKKRPGLKQRFLDWFRRMGDAYTRP